MRLRFVMATALIVVVGAPVSAASMRECSVTVCAEASLEQNPLTCGLPSDGVVQCRMEASGRGMGSTPIVVGPAALPGSVSLRVTIVDCRWSPDDGPPVEWTACGPLPVTKTVSASWDGAGGNASASLDASVAMEFTVPLDPDVCTGLRLDVNVTTAAQTEPAGLAVDSAEASDGVVVFWGLCPESL